MLDLNELDTDDIPGVDRQKGNDLAKAAAVCLESQKHVPGVSLTIRGVSNSSYTLTWPLVTPQSRRTRADAQEATEDGAAGIATLLAIREIGHNVILRSLKTTGIDYWLGNDDRSNVNIAEWTKTTELQDLLEDESLVVRGRMEVSGILQGNDSEIRARTKGKLSQTDQSDSSGLPAYIIVVEFGRPLAEVTRK